MTRIIVFLVISLWILGVIEPTLGENKTEKVLNGTCEDLVPDCGGFKDEEICQDEKKSYGAFFCRKHCNFCSVDDHCRDNKTVECAKIDCNTTEALYECQKTCGFCGVLGNQCKEKKHFCERIRGASCTNNTCNCKKGFREKASIQCEEVFWKHCNATEKCDELAHSECKIPQSPSVTVAPWTNISHCICKDGFVYNHTGHSCDADCGSNLASIQHGSPTLDVKNYTTTGAVATVKCDTGFYANVSKITCELHGESGTWTNATCNQVHQRNCTNASDCQNLPNSNCSSTSCACLQGFYYNKNNYSCDAECPTISNPMNGTVDTSEHIKAVYKCDTGFDLTGPKELHCMNDGQWNNTTNLTKCVIRDCNHVSAPKDGNVTTINGTTYQSVANFSCHTGYTLFGDNTTTCEASGNWSTYEVNCTIKDCRQPPHLENGNFTNNGSTYQSVANFSCHTGYTLFGNNSATCEASGNWSKYEVHCTINDCGNVTAPNNGTVNMNNGTTYQSVAYFSCNTGYTLYGDNTTTCEASGNWSSYEVNCTIKDCKSPGDLDNGTVNLNENTTTFNSTATFTCNEGYDLIGNTSSTCNSSGQWDTELPSCNIKDCRQPPDLENGNFTNNGSTYQSVANFSCHTGYTLFGNNSATCEASGNWSKYEVHCTINDCGNVTAPNNGTVNMNNGTTYQSVAYFSCNTGYTLYGDNTTTCEASGNWSSYEVNCTIKDCKSPGDLDNGTVNLNENTTTFNSTATFTCNEGYDLIGNTSSTCNSSGQWDTELPSCNIKDCRQPPDLENGNFTNNGSTYQSVANFSCHTGYTLFGNNSATCEASGNWSKYEVHCTINDCGNVTAPNNGTVNMNNGTTYQSVAYFSCNTGYTLYGDNTTTCEASGNWSSYEVNCTIKDCKSPGDLDNGTVNLNENTTTFNSTATFTCKEGYDLIGNTSSTCNSSGQWDTELPSCNIKDCRQPPDLENGNFTNNGSTYQSVANFSCHTGYTLFGNNSATCEASGNWSKYEVHCTINDCGNVTAPNNGTVNMNNGTTYQSVAYFSCNTGYTLYGDNTTTCEASGNWSSYEVNCTIKDCGSLCNLDNGTVNLNENTTTYNSTATFTCNEGYDLIGNTSSTCNSSGQWDTELPSCIIKDCNNVPAPNNGTVTKINGTKYQSIANFSCNTGYTLFGNNVATCESSGNWSIDVNCTINDCGEPKQVNGGFYSNTSGITTYQTVVSYTCHPGFDFIGDHDATCLANKTWSGKRYCKIKECSTPSSIANGTFAPSTKPYNFNLTVSYTCDNGYHTENKTNMTCNASAVWDTPAPQCDDIDECKTYDTRCHKWAKCTNTPGNYTCECKEGFNDTSHGEGITCEDINECANTSRCNRSNSQCVNYPGGSECFCFDGWNGTNCEIDIDECNDTNACGVGASCTNFDGGYNCTCNSSVPKGNPKVHCYENVIIELKTNSTVSRGDNELIEAKPFPNRIPYFGEEFASYRPYMNGFITLGYQPLYENYGPVDPNEWKRITRGFTVIAPLWTDLDSTDLSGGLHVNMLDYYEAGSDNSSIRKDLEKLGDTFSSLPNLTEFEPRVALVATWENVTRSSYILPTRLISSENATMQMILASDGIYTYLMFNYDQEQWSLKLNKNISSSAGYSLLNRTGAIIANQTNYRSLQNNSNVKPALNGRSIYNVSSTDMKINAILKNNTDCLAFGHNDIIKKWLKDENAKSDACPCSEIQIEYDYTFQEATPMYTNQQIKTTCYEKYIFNIDGVKQTCCYRMGALKKEGTGGGFATFEKDPHNTIDYFYKCCGDDTDRHLCHIYYDMNPSDDCSRYEPFDEPIVRKKRSLIGYMKLSKDLITRKKPPVQGIW